MLAVREYGMPIQIISINDFSDPNPKSERIEPDADFVVEKVIIVVQKLQIFH